jgi:predicted phosphodiesterase
VKFGAVSDIHGNLPALQSVLDDAAAHGDVLDGWLNLGDILSGPLWPAETADFLMALATDSASTRTPWHTMAGNHERQVLTQPLAKMSAADRFTAEHLAPRHRIWLAALPLRLAPAPGLVCVHGTPSSDLTCWLETLAPEGLREASDGEVVQRAGDEAARAEAGALVLCGHSHLPRERRIGALHVANPGSVGLPAYDDEHPHSHVVETGSPHARYAVVSRADSASAWQVELRRVTYDWHAAASQAERNRRGDWADALRTGRVGRREGDIA